MVAGSLWRGGAFSALHPRQQAPKPPYLTNVRNTESRYWLPWLRAEHRCWYLRPALLNPTSNQGARSIWTWFARDESRPLMFFAGIWREWEGTRGTRAEPATGNHKLFSFITTDASPDVSPITLTPSCPAAGRGTHAKCG